MRVTGQGRLGGIGRVERKKLGCKVFEPTRVDDCIVSRRVVRTEMWLNGNISLEISEAKNLRQEIY